MLAGLARLAAHLVDAGALEAEELRRLALAPAAEETATVGGVLDGIAQRLSALH